MSEWEVVGVLVALLGLIAAIAGPLIKLNTSITTLTVTLKDLNDDIDDLTVKNTKSHQRLWDHNEEQDKKLNDHEMRLTIVEKEVNHE
ncbi:hypothetical protein [Hominifimenecus sp. rT4P-3]|uniref:hypothetical protein n=1 Tax=Hominifimenecus sp. rT4P-3 TaxID=3242979 RepID=UPI003DA6A81B